MNRTITYTISTICLQLLSTGHIVTLDDILNEVKSYKEKNNIELTNEEEEDILSAVCNALYSD